MDHTPDAALPVSLEYGANLCRLRKVCTVGVDFSAFKLNVGGVGGEFAPRQLRDPGQGLRLRIVVVVN